MTGIAPDAMARLKAYPWPGNIRELRNAVERAMLLTDGEELTLEHFPLGGGLAVKLGEGVALPGRRHRPRAARALTRRPGARTQRMEPNESRGPPRTEPRSDSLPDREVQARTTQRRTRLRAASAPKSGAPEPITRSLGKSPQRVGYSPDCARRASRLWRTPNGGERHSPCLGRTVG